MTVGATTVLVAEDEATLRDFVARNLRARGFAVLEAANGLEALALWEGEPVQLLILDVMMPRLDGLEVCRRVRETSTVPIIVLTALDEERDKIAAFDLGADDYLTKPFGAGELLARVRAVLRRTAWGQGTPVAGARRFGDLAIDFDGHTVLRGEAEIRLTPTEFALLACLAQNPDRVLTHRMLLQRVWGETYGGESEYLRVYIGRLRRKLEADPANPRHLQTVPGVGYRLATGPGGESR